MRTTRGSRLALAAAGRAAAPVGFRTAGRSWPVPAAAWIAVPTVSRATGRSRWALATTAWAAALVAFRTTGRSSPTSKPEDLP
jgi:hypothetical protein